MWDLATIVRRNREWGGAPKFVPVKGRTVDFVLNRRGPIYIVEPKNPDAELFLQRTYGCGTFVGASLAVETNQIDAVAANLFDEGFLVCSSL